jgi:hypothetical protein
VDLRARRASLAGSLATSPPEKFEERTVTRFRILESLVFLVVTLTMSGCSDPELQRELDFAQASVESALAAWKRSETAESLKALPQPIEFHDDDWREGVRLVDYQIVQVYHDTDGLPRCAVRLTLQRSEREQEQIDEIYQIVTKPNVIIARDPMS